MEEQDKQKLIQAMDHKKEEVLSIFQRILSTDFLDDVNMILFHTEEIYDDGFGYSIHTQEDIDEEAPSYYDEQGNPVYDDIGPGSINFTITLDMKAVSDREEVPHYFRVAKKLFAEWLHDRWKEAGGENSPVEFALTYQEDYPDYYDLRTLEHND
ncbi:hypothetical protein [Paludifilum halophilum]|uniref:Uncharacterized protein n=1 Tax=Paludifilum halophilum TaxID=1642702 RepID=A0A235B635_9BACL|nr:hypothetical protein [Paludifilum halophilum]OYD07766.1 hypothetical protein CHM34_09870 [Paludifilum halophilum]